MGCRAVALCLLRLHDNAPSRACPRARLRRRVVFWRWACRLCVLQWARAHGRTVGGGVRWPETKKPLRVQRLFMCLVPRRGLEPPRCYSLVPETSASTNSATWAFRSDLNYRTFFGVARKFANFFENCWKAARDRLMAVALSTGMHAVRGGCREASGSGVVCCPLQLAAKMWCGACAENKKAAVDTAASSIFRKPALVLVKLGAQERTRTSTMLLAST